MDKTKFTNEKIKEILKQVKEKSTPYYYRTKDYPFEVICSKYGDEKDLNSTLYVPGYQKKFVWKPDRQSKFIESVLLGVPLTPFLVSEDKDSRLEIIDGSQRIRTLIAFFENKLQLKKLEELTEINTAKFKDLPSYLQHQIKNRDFRVIVVDNAEIKIRQEIFERINTTSEILTDVKILTNAEIRKGSYSGKFYDLVLELKENKKFRDICPVSTKKEERGEYEELILRFFAYIDSYKEFKHDVAVFLNAYLEEMNEKDFDKKQYQKNFCSMVDFIRNNYCMGFRKEEKSKSTPRVRFEAISVGTYLAIKENPDLCNPDLKWLESEGFKIQTTSDSSNNPNRLEKRVEFVRDGLLGKLDDQRLKDG